MKIYLFLLPNNLEQYSLPINKDFNLNNKKIIYTSFPKKVTKSYLKIINVKDGVIRPLPNFRSYDSIISYIKNDSFIKSKSKSKPKIMVLTKFSLGSQLALKKNRQTKKKYRCSGACSKHCNRSSRISKNCKGKCLKHCSNQNGGAEPEENIIKLPKSCVGSLEQLYKLNKDVTSAEPDFLYDYRYYLNFHKILSDCRPFKKTLSAGFLILDSSAVSKNDGMRFYPAEAF